MKNELSVLGRTLGILALIFFWVPGFGFLTGIAGILISSVAHNRSKTIGDGEQMARTGLTLSIIALAVAALIMLILVATAAGGFFSRLSDWGY